MKPKLIYIINHLTSLFPLTSLLRLKFDLYRFAGVKIVSSDRLTSNGVWIGAKATIIGGAKIDKKSVNEAGSVVVNEIPPGVIAGGVPCKTIKSLDEQKII